MDWRHSNTDRAFAVAAAADPALLRHLHRLISAALTEEWTIEQVRQALETSS